MDSKLNGIIKNRINKLFELSFKNVKKNLGLATRYVKLARKLSSRHRIQISKRFKRRFCKECNRPWIPGYNVNVKMNKRKKYIKYTCECDAKRRFRYK